VYETIGCKAATGVSKPQTILKPMIIKETIAKKNG